ncbi:acyl-[acyl-carrier-protein]--UDP-N-acetylglucosamine O-acyltransferase [Breznakibacter xylanolyticus]|uniref:Acyl-[acyl-carrier-protein]--UDP-N-acetylglucosamine O-acyltransferase n=1 Tax=Breznakibacter xylanolyticus TaxID=990 RepID=A0A2W7QFB9_9BACT|nr:acyl-ACP--UDP-N-acetylglucosamine O-acyltransferase [Breznakibacter xylanolyticus]PZX20629.1 acyl-[acyl-carrier-protein]--UDP-N-acetylglucosamine O-acyltransferase [Breznakibacter xylanolyticus]
MTQPLAYIHPEAQIGQNVEIGPFAFIDKDVVIGDGTVIGPNATVMNGARIGKNCRIFPGAVIAGVPQDLKFKGEATTAEIGDNTTVRECVTVNRGTASRGKTVVGSNCLLMAYAHIAHDCILKDYIIIGNGTQLAGEVEIDDHAIVSAHTLVHQFSRIGAHVMIGGGSRLGKDVPPFVKMHHAKMAYAGINSVGLRRRNFSNEKINEIQGIYRLLFQSKLNNTQALERIEAEYPASEERDMIIDFVRNSPRGIIKGYVAERED